MIYMLNGILYDSSFIYMVYENIENVGEFVGKG